MAQGFTKGITIPVPVNQGGTGTTTSTGTGSVVLNTSPTIITPNTVGVTNGSSAATGSVGEVISINIPRTLPLTSGAAGDIGSTPLSAGMWVIYGNVTSSVTGAGSATVFYCWASIASATLPSDLSNVSTLALAPGDAGQSLGTNIPVIILNITVPTTVYLSYFVAFTPTAVGGGNLIALRIR